MNAERKCRETALVARSGQGEVRQETTLSGSLFKVPSVRFSPRACCWSCTTRLSTWVWRAICRFATLSSRSSSNSRPPQRRDQGLDLTDAIRSRSALCDAYPDDLAGFHPGCRPADDRTRRRLRNPECNGTGVFGGMLSATVLAVFFVPVLTLPSLD